MTTLIYATPLQEKQATTPRGQTARSQNSIQGLLQNAGLSVESIATESVDLSIEGGIRFGEFSVKVRRELDSLGESTFSKVPLYSDSTTLEDRGYYEVASTDVNPVHRNSQLAYEYTIQLQKAGTRKEHYRSVATNEESISTGLATGTNGQIGVPTEASNPRWFDQENGTELATVKSTANAEFGGVDLFTPDDATAEDPTLVYDLEYANEASVDVRLWDDRDESKFVTYDSTDINQWYHVYHPNFEFDGQPIADNGLLRLQFDPANNHIDADEWDDASQTWTDLDTAGGTGQNYTLFDFDIETVGPADVTVFTEWQDTGDNSIASAVLSVQRGIDRAVVRQPDNGTIPSDLETVLDPIASDQTTDPNPDQDVTPRQAVK